MGANTYRVLVHPNPPNGPVAHGYPATLLPDICDAILSARSARDLYPRQFGLAERSELLIRGLAHVGIIALVDEATGYQRIREERALATILEKFLDQDLQPWSRTFDFTFYEQIFRLKGWGSAVGVKRPQVIGHYTNDIVYDRIAPGVLAELRERNPVLPQGWRKNRHHQWFTPEYGHPRLKMHMEGVTALMRAAQSWESSKRSLDRAYPKTGREAVEAVGVVPVYLSRQRTSPVRGHAHQWAHSGIEGGPWSTCPAERAWLHELTPLFRFLLSAGPSVAKTAKAPADPPYTL